MNTQNRKFPRKVLIYLTIAGTGSEEADKESIRYTRLSYTQDIARFCSAALATTQADRVTSTVEQYMQTAENLDWRHRQMTKRDLVSMDFLMSEKNLVAALQISSYVEKVQERLLSEFWKEILTSVARLLEDSSAGDNWTVSFRQSEKQKELTPTKDWYGIDIFEESRKDKPDIRYTISQEKIHSAPQLNFAVYRYGDHSRYSLPADRKKLESLYTDIRNVHSQSERGHYIAYDSWPFQSIVDFYVFMSGENCADHAREVADAAWGRFTGVKDAMQQINALLEGIS
jgi:hypothetical protein